MLRGGQRRDDNGCYAAGPRSRQQEVAIVPADPAAERLAPLLGRLVNYERTRPAARLWDLRTAQALLARPGAVPATGRAIQVGGSKGKGTVCSFLEGLARAAGLHTGVYLSPHVETLLERVRLDGRLVDVAQLEDALAAVVSHAAATGFEPTFFEAMTVAARDLFAAQRVDLAVYEVGLGGRFDATTAIPVAASVLTGIELEHTEVLGDTVEAIAAEKAPVIRPGGCGITSTTGPALAVVQAHARAVGARLLLLGRDFDLQGGLAGSDWRGRLRLPGGRDLAVTLPDARGFEPRMLALAAAALHQVSPDLHLQLDPAPRPTLPCRFEVVRDADGKAVILDGAHTEQSLAAVAAELARRHPGRPAAVLFGCARGKRWREGLSPLLPLADGFLVTELSGTAGEDPQAIVGWLRERGCRAETTPDAGTGLRELLLRPEPRLVCGSFYLAGAVRRLLHHPGGGTT